MHRLFKRTPVIGQSGYMCSRQPTWSITSLCYPDLKRFSSLWPYGIAVEITFNPRVPTTLRDRF